MILWKAVPVKTEGRAVNPFRDKNIYGLRLAGYLEIALLGYIGNLVNKI